MPMRAVRLTTSWSAILVAAMLAQSAPARAQSASDKVAAEALFDQGKKLLAEGKVAEACPKFAESNRLDVGLGTMLYLADCYEKSGQTASAWAQFREAAAMAARQGDPREKIARERAARLEPKLSKLSVSVSGADVTGLEIKRDGEPLGKALWGIEVPVDPGAHTIVASAPGKKEWQSTVQVGANAAPVAVSVPPLEDAPIAAAPVAPVAPSETSQTSMATDATAAPPPRGNSQRVAGLVVGGIGVVGVGVGAFFGLQAKSSLDDSNADNHCHDGNKCDAVGVQARSDAASRATISTIAFIAGGVAIAGGAVLYFTAPKAPARVGLVPSIGPREQGLVLRGAW